MYLNWTPEVVVDLFLGISFLIGGIFSFKNIDKIKIKTLIYLKLVWFSLSVYFFLEGLSIFILNLLLYRLYAIIAFPATVFLFLAINYNFKEKINSISLIPIFCLGTFLCFLSFQPNTAKIIVEDGFFTIIWTGLFNIIGVLFLFIFCISFFFWALKTWINAPFEIKKEASIFLIGTTIATISSHIIFSFTIWKYSFIIISDLTTLIGLLICDIIIKKEPKLLYILPFIPYKLHICNIEGNELFSYTWTKSSVNEAFLSNSLIIKELNKNLMHIERFLDIKIEDRILILYKSKSFITIFDISKPSKIVRDLIKYFAEEFEIQFEKELKELTIDSANFKSAINLVKKYFSIFPSRIIRNNKQQLLFSKKHVKIPIELENKLKEIIKDEKEFESLKCEIQRSPEKVSEEFISLYNEIKKESSNDDKEK